MQPKSQNESGIVAVIRKILVAESFVCSELRSGIRLRAFTVWLGSASSSSLALNVMQFSSRLVKRTKDNKISGSWDNAVLIIPLRQLSSLTTENIKSSAIKLRHDEKRREGIVSFCQQIHNVGC